MIDVFDRRLIFVTGKGGVGKSTVSIALGMVAARRGLRTIVAELGRQDRIQQAFEQRAAQFTEVQLAPGLFTISIDPQQAMEEYLRVKTGTVGQMLASSRLFAAFAMATPGMRELLSIGKVWELAQLERRTRGAAPYDLVIVDAPATGHGVGILRTPRTFADIARVGPIAHQGRTIADTILDRSFTALLAVATAEEMPVNETLAMREALAGDGLQLDGLILNAAYARRFSATDARRLRGALEARPSGPAQGALRAALSAHTRTKLQVRQRRRLEEGLGMKAVALPSLFSDGIGPQELEVLADALAPEIKSAAGLAAPAPRSDSRRRVADEHR